VRKVAATASIFFKTLSSVIASELFCGVLAVAYKKLQSKPSPVTRKLPGSVEETPKKLVAMVRGNASERIFILKSSTGAVRSGLFPLGQYFIALHCAVVIRNRFVTHNRNCTRNWFDDVQQLISDGLVVSRRYYIGLDLV
jgi:hypothetical protein